MYCTPCWSRFLNLELYQEHASKCLVVAERNRNMYQIKSPELCLNVGPFFDKVEVLRPFWPDDETREKYERMVKYRSEDGSETESDMQVVIIPRRTSGQNSTGGCQNSTPVWSRGGHESDVPNPKYTVDLEPSSQEEECKSCHERVSGLKEEIKKRHGDEFRDRIFEKEGRLKEKYKKYLSKNKSKCPKCKIEFCTNFDTKCHIRAVHLALNVQTVINLLNQTISHRCLQLGS